MPYDLIGRAKHLTTLTVGRDIFRPTCLQAIGSLSHLKNLRILNFGFQAELLGDVALSGESFPALRSLTIDDLCPPELMGVFVLLPLVRNLTTLNIQISDPHDWLGVENTTLFSTIANASPNINDLSINFCYPAEFVAQDLLALSPLALRSLSLFAHDILLGQPYDYCPILAATFPQLQRLVMPEQEVYFWSLCWFAEFKQLEHLSVLIQWWPSKKPSHREALPSHTSPKLQTLECDMNRPRTFDLRIPESAYIDFAR